MPGLRWWYDDAEEAHERGTEILEGLWRWGLYPRERARLKEREGEEEGERLGVEVSEWVPEPFSRHTSRSKMGFYEKIYELTKQDRYLGIILQTQLAPPPAYISMPPSPRLYSTSVPASSKLAAARPTHRMETRNLAFGGYLVRML